MTTTVPTMTLTLADIEKWLERQELDAVISTGLTAFPMMHGLFSRVLYDKYAWIQHPAGSYFDFGASEDSVTFELLQPLRHGMNRWEVTILPEERETLKRMVRALQDYIDGFSGGRDGAVTKREWLYGVKDETRDKALPLYASQSYHVLDISLEIEHHLGR